MKKYLLSEDVLILPTISLCSAALGMGALIVSMARTFITGTYDSQITEFALILIAASVLLWGIHVLIDAIIEDNNRRKRMNAAIDSDPVLNNDTVNFVEDDRYSDWERYHSGK